MVCFIPIFDNVVGWQERNHNGLHSKTTLRAVLLIRHFVRGKCDRAIDHVRTKLRDKSGMLQIPLVGKFRTDSYKTKQATRLTSLVDQGDVVPDLETTEFARFVDGSWLACAIDEGVDQSR
jgi:hypothetical protein